MPRGDFLSVPCTFPDLRDDRHLKGAIRFAVEKQLRSLETQCEQGAFVHRLIAFAESLLQKVRGVAARRPASGGSGDLVTATIKERRFRGRSAGDRLDR